MLCSLQGSMPMFVIWVRECSIELDRAPESSAQTRRRRGPARPQLPGRYVGGTRLTLARRRGLSSSRRARCPCRFGAFRRQRRWSWRRCSTHSLRAVSVLLRRGGSLLATLQLADEGPLACPRRPSTAPRAAARTPLLCRRSRRTRCSPLRTAPPRSDACDLLLQALRPNSKSSRPRRSMPSSSRPRSRSRRERSTCWP